MNLSEKLGFPKKTKLLMIHADDAGLSHSENMATIKSLQEGIVNSYSIMVPCPWFYEMAKFTRENPQFDHGVHLTLTCEWENYKFGPVLPISEVPSLVDENGYFFKNREELKKNAQTEDVKKELTAQIERVLKFGLNPTHLDSHMYSVGAKPEFFKVYKFLGEKYNLPVLINRQLIEMAGLDTETTITEKDFHIEKVYLGSFDSFKKGELKNYYAGVFDKLADNQVNLILIHPAFNDSEMKGITINHPNFGAEWRQVDFDSFTSTQCKVQLEKNNIELITWGDLNKVYNSN